MAKTSTERALKAMEGYASYWFIKRLEPQHPNY